MSCILRLTALLFLGVGICRGFVPVRTAVSFVSLSPLFATTVKISTPSPDDAADMGIRDWPQQLKKAGSWSETVDEDQTLVRYVLDGTGAVNVVDENGQDEKTAVGPGSLVEVTGQATLEWQGKEDMIILTPGYEQPGMLIGAAALLLIVTVVGTGLIGG